MLTVMRRTTVAVLLALPAVPLVAQSGVAASPAAAFQRPELVAVRQVTEKYRDVKAALADGFVASPDCLDYPGHGAMGIHYVHPARFGLVVKDGRVDGTDGALDPLKPEVLIYEPQTDKSLQLVAVEYITSRAAWGNRPAPRLFGVAFDFMHDDPATPGDEGHGFTPHYDLHVWMYRDNPKGAFAQWNPAVSCKAAEKTEIFGGHAKH